MEQVLLGVDCGLTVTKAVVFGRDGRQLGSAAARTAHATPRPRWIERDMRTVWQDCAGVIQAALASAGVRATDVAAVGVTGHGDGLYLVDEAGEPVRPAILSMDSRAVDVLAEMGAAGRLRRALEVTGQVPFPGSTAALTAWVASAEPGSLERTRHLLGCKDWIKLHLTGQISTDPTVASSTFTDVRTQRYSPDALAVYSLEGLEDKLPSVVGSAEVAGTVTADVARVTGLAAGTPVIAGLHDVDACAIGIGAATPGQMSIIAGSFSINQTVANQPVIDERWLCRNFINPGQWLHLSVSPASASNLEWFVAELCSQPGTRAVAAPGVFEILEQEVQAALRRPREVWYLPFLYGSPLDNRASAAFVGLRGWHTRGDMARALFEGVVFNHLWHIEALGSAFESSEARLTGGGSRNATWSQLFSDAIGLPIVVTEVEE
jgi:L-xylulokinase